MTIIPYEPKYHDDVVSIVKNFYNEALSEFSQEIDLNSLEATIENLKKDSFLLIMDDKCVGLIAGQVTTNPLNNNKVFQELIWFTHKDYRRYGIMMLNEVEKRLKESGITQIVMALIHNSKANQLAKFYEKIGFRPMETHFIKNL